MEIFDLLKLSAQGYENRNVNVFFQNELFKTRVIALDPGGNSPECKMESFVLFYVVSGEVLLGRNGESSTLREGQVFISEPALISMTSVSGARLMGVQIGTQNAG